VQQCRQYDGYLCGIGIRLGKYGYFLASATSVLRITESLSERNTHGPPGVFRFGSPTQVDISKPDNDAEGSRYKPRFIKMYVHNIGVYKTQPHEFLLRRPYEARRTFLPRNLAVAPLRSDQGEAENCMVLSYGDKKNRRQSAHTPSKYGSRKTNQLHR
jgi:hypothetical protein